MSRESMRKPEIHSVATFSIVIPGSEILRWFKPQNVGTMVIAEVVPSHLCYKWMGMAGCAVFSCHFLHSRKNCSMELCFLRCHIEVNKHQVYRNPQSLAISLLGLDHVTKVHVIIVSLSYKSLPSKFTLVQSLIYRLTDSTL